LVGKRSLKKKGGEGDYEQRRPGNSKHSIALYEGRQGEGGKKGDLSGMKATLKEDGERVLRVKTKKVWDGTMACENTEKLRTSTHRTAAWRKTVSIQSDTEKCA